MLKTDYLVLSPYFNEEGGIARFLRDLNSVIEVMDAKFSILLIDDCSYDESFEKVLEFRKGSSLDVKVLRLPFNVGQQNAIWIGINYILTNREFLPASGLIVMDSDGEDRPETIKDLVRCSTGLDVCFVERGKRHEGLVFKVSYWLYKRLFHFLTGKSMTFGNYSVVSPGFLQKIGQQPFMHFSSFLYKKTVRIGKLKADRGKRYSGQSKIGFKGLFLHAFRSIIEFSDELVFFMIKLMMVILTGVLGMVVWIVLDKFVFRNAITGWASTFGMMLLLTIIVLFVAIVILLVLSSLKNEYRLSMQKQLFLHELQVEDAAVVTAKAEIA